jgi:predicted short-subunit dehydrogenase-like oxidoreductase (DUF2520 family)
MMNEIKKASIIGSGNMATFWAKCFFEHRFPLKSIVSRNQEKGSLLANEYGTEWHSDYPEFEEDEMVMLCLSDDAIENISNNIQCKNILHCSGAISIDALKKHQNRAVAYPLQTIHSDYSLSIEKIPILIETTSSNQALQNWLSQFNFNMQYVDSNQRLKYHIAAVFANNFTNAMLVLTQDYCHNQTLDFNLLNPLIQQTFQQLENKNPSEVQTGPAKRNDLKTIQKHLEALKDEKQMSDIYQMMSEFIRKRF